MTTGNGQYFSLNADCFLVTGAVNAAIYHLSSGDVYAIDSVGRTVLERIEQGFPVTDVYPDVPQISEPAEMLAYLHELEALGLGRFHNGPAQSTKIDLPPASFVLRKVWLELTVRCNLRCLHCYADASSQGENGALSLGQWQATISEAASLGAQWIQFIGGEPLLFGKQNLFALIARARESRFQIVEIFSNGILLDDECIEFFAEHGVQVALSVYAKQPEIHDQVTQCPGSFQRTMCNAEKLRNRNVPVRFSLVVMRHNSPYEQETLAWIQSKFDTTLACSDVIRCTPGGRGQQTGLLTPELWMRQLRTDPDFPRVDIDRFVQNKFGHPCLCGTICVQANGNVYPCIMDRTHVLGNVAKSNLGKIVSGPETRTIWGLSKDQIPACRDCEYRYACMDCRPLAIGMAEALEEPQQGLFAKNPCCLYDPYAGEWGNADEFLEKVAARGLLVVPQS
jgi:radical SAM protein with 4Fe4S-binding SPASM domain